MLASLTIGLPTETAGLSSLSKMLTVTELFESSAFTGFDNTIFKSLSSSSRSSSIAANEIDAWVSPGLKVRVPLIAV